MSRPRAVLFDLDGTLVDSLPTVARAMADAMREHGFEVNPDEVIPLIGPPMDLLVQQLTGCEPAVAERVNADFMRRYYEDLIQSTPPMPGAEALLDRLRGASVALGVITNKVEAGGRQMLDIQGWSDRFDVVVGRDTTLAKPAPDGALLALEQLGARAEEGAIVGDTEFDTQCGASAGLRYVVALGGNRPDEQLRATGATHIVRSLEEAAEVLLTAEDGPR